MFDLACILGVLVIGFAWRATTVAGLANAAMATIVVVPLAIGVGAARGEWVATAATGLAFAGGYALAGAVQRREIVSS